MSGFKIDDSFEVSGFKIHDSFEVLDSKYMTCLKCLAEAASFDTGNWYYFDFVATVVVFLLA